MSEINSKIRIIENRSKENGIDKMSEKSRINAWISKGNYEGINNIMKTSELIAMKLSKGAILDLALSQLFINLDCGETLENIAIQHLERIGDVKQGGD